MSELDCGPGNALHAASWAADREELAALRARAEAAERERDEANRKLDAFRDGLQRARELYREKSGKPDMFAGEGDWWNEPDDTHVVLWLFEWSEDITADICEQLKQERDEARGFQAQAEALLESVEVERDELSVAGRALLGFVRWVHGSAHGCALAGTSLDALVLEMKASQSLSAAGSIAAEVERVKRLEALPKFILDLGHNDECLFCGFKDKYARAALGADHLQDATKKVEAHNAE